MSRSRIPFNKPAVVGDEFAYMAQSIASGRISADGGFTAKCQSILEKDFGARKAILTVSCTAALEMAAILSRVGPGDEVIMPAFTFVSTANAFVLRGARPVFVDVRPDTMNMDERLVAQAVNARTRVIVPVHYAGVACEMDALMATAAAHDLLVVEDAAHAVSGDYKGRRLGTIGDFGTYSFHETKNVTSGEGGALLVNRADLVDRAEIVRDKGTNRRQFQLGQVDKYAWVDIGSSYGMADILAAYLYGQLEKRDEIAAHRAALYERYISRLTPLATRGDLELPHIPAHCQSGHHMTYITLADRTTRDRLIDHLAAQGIQAVFHYMPLHTSPFGEQFGCRPGMLPVTEDRAYRLLRLPFFNQMPLESADEVVRHVFDFFGAPLP
ncbi:MAG: dTDP-4-amino-4,6-dideoxygalactose transaminase [Alphaproteobacteria bacterium]